MHDFVNGEAFRPFSKEPTGMEIRGITAENFQIFCVAIAVDKIVTRRLSSRIILEAVVNASSRRHRGLGHVCGYKRL